MNDPGGILRRTELFSGLDAKALNELASRLFERRFRRGETLFHEGDDGDALYVIVDGSVAIVVTSESGKRAVLTTLREQDVLGEIALLDGGPRSATAEAVEDTTTLVLARKAFLRAIQDHPPMVEQLFRGFGRKVRRLTEQASDFVFLDTKGRIAKVLVRLAEIDGDISGGFPAEVRITQARLAEMVGGSRQTVSDILHGFR